jgi:aminopeptidase YwaD
VLKHHLLAATACLVLANAAHAQPAGNITEARVRAHVELLAGPGLRGRGSATPDEAAAAAYAASVFRGLGLRPAPGMSGYLQPIDVTRLRLDGTATLSVDGAALPVPTVIMASAPQVTGKLSVFAGTDPAQLPAADVVLASAPGFPLMGAFRSPAMAKVKLLVLRESEESRSLLARIGGKPRLPAYLSGEAPTPGPTIVTLPAEAFDRLAAQGGADVALSLPLVEDEAVTTNAVGYLPGTDPNAGVLLLSAHLDHLGVRPDGTIMYGANDDASGVAAVLELARALSASKRLRRGILFVGYGSEEAGGFGARRFAEQPPVPLLNIIANIQFEMTGAQDPKLAPGEMMMTGFERSTLGETLRAAGARVAPDPYPEQNFFRRSDNYKLAQKGVVAHTVSGWAVVPTYHQPTDTIDKLDFAFMAGATQSLVEPIRRIANGSQRPEWKPGGRPAE